MKQQKRRRRKRQDRLVLHLLLLVTLVLVVFEGRLIYTMFTHSFALTASDASDAEAQAPDGAEGQTERPGDGLSSAALPSSDPSGTSSGELFLAGLQWDADRAGAQEQEPDTLPTVSDPESAAIVRKADPPVDDSYFSDAVFIGDSRMEGFRNASGITQGRFFTSVGMSLSSMASEPVISTADGNITVAAALSGGRYNKIYIMLGTNDLGEFDWDSFRDGFVSVTRRFQEIQPGALIYICSVIYVEESKVPSTQYVNNANVDKINSILLDVCEQEGYHYIDFNEILSNGYGSLTEGASSDGVHMYGQYCQQMLGYLKSHYIEYTPSDKDSTAETEQDQEESESEAESG